MPTAFPATVAEREAELIALQSAFDEYIASSRELEEELDAELAKMQEKLAESTAANAALTAQLENIGPQLSSLEGGLAQARKKIAHEQEMRRAAEQSQDALEQAARETQQSLLQAREECDAAHEELAFTQSELEELRLELEVEKQDLQNELAATRQLVRKQEKDDNQQQTSAETPREVPAASAENEEYARKLEEELELVTEQLIDLEQKLHETEQAKSDLENELATQQQESAQTEHDNDLIRQLQAENADRLEAEQRLREQIKLSEEELTLSKEEVALQQEELQAAEEDYKNTALELEELRVKYKEEVGQWQIKAKEAEMASKQSLGEAALVVTTVTEANEKNASLEQEVAALEAALANAKSDYQNVLDELETVNQRFDEARAEARREGEEAALEQARETKKSDDEHEVQQVREELSKLTQENASLQEKIDSVTMELATVRDQNKGASTTNAEQSEVVQQLHAQLARVKEDVQKKEAEVTELTNALEQGVTKAEEKVLQLDVQLRNTKSKLAEAEGRIIVYKREKERAENKIASSPTRASASSRPPSSPTKSGGRSRSVEREELSGVDNAPSPARTRSRSSSPSSVLRLEYRLKEEQVKYSELQSKYDSLQDQKRMGEVRIKRMEEDLKFLQKQLFSNGGDGGAVVTQMTRLSSLATSNKGMDVMISDESGTDRVEEIISSRDVKTMGEELKALAKKCNSQREYNAQLLSKMLHLQGNIQVYCRIRPMSMGEVEKGYKMIAEPLSETEVGCFDDRTKKWKSFAFDRVWGPDQSQQSVFQDVEPLALSVVDGYGQTGSGKTYTMEGSEQENQFGISYRTIQKIFHLLNLRAQQQRAAEMFVGNEEEDGVAKEVSFAFSIQVGMLEIYNDEIFDLLNTSGSTMEEKKQGAMRAGGKASLDIRRNKDGRIEVPNLTKESVVTIEEVMEVLKRGNANRATASTDMNEHSSRSHMVLMVDVVSGLDDAESNKGTLYLVDLAGSERVRKSNVAGDQLKEAGFINKSLSALGNVMEALDRKASHVPYRDSKLTYMLQDSLGGNSRTMMVVAICPNDNSFDESIHALQFATRVRRIQIGAAQRNVTSKNLEETVKSLTDEMRALTRAKERSEGQLHSLKRDNARVQEKLQNLNKSRTQNRSDSKTLEMLRKNNDDMAARWQKEKAAREEATEDLDKTQKELRNVKNQLSKLKTTVQGLEKTVENKDRELKQTSRSLVDARNTKSATAVRARRDQLIGARKRPVTSAPSGSKPTSPSSTAAQASAPETPRSITVSSDASPNGDGDVRSKVLALLEKHDPVKVDRIDIIMEKFTGKETLLLEKMTQRYEGGATNSFLKRNQMSVQRHQERMKRIRDKKGG